MTNEPASEAGPKLDLASIPFIDAHHHFWDLDANHHPWLCDDDPIPFRYGNYDAIRKNYLPADLRADAAGFNLVGSVYVEAEWDPTDPIGESRWVESIMAESGLPNAIVAQAWLDRTDVADVLAAQAERPAVRGIRHKPRAAASPSELVDGAPGSMSDVHWRAGYELLGRYGFSFDLQVVPWHLPEAARLAADFPDTPLVLNHTGLPADRSAEGLRLWRAGMERLAEQPNAVVKISGLGQAGRAWSVTAQREVVRETIRIFGTDRCMLASNFPVDGLVGSYHTIVGGLLAIAAEHGADTLHKLSYANAVRYYRLEGLPARAG